MRDKHSRSRKLWSALAYTRLARDVETSIKKAIRSASNVLPRPQARTSPAIPSKYKNQRSKGFASKKEAKRYQELRMLNLAGKIADLQTQVPFRIEINGVLVCKYIADFTYRERAMQIVEDCKGYRTAIYRLKAKLMRAVHGITIRES